MCVNAQEFENHEGFYKILRFGGRPLSLQVKLNTIHPDKSHIPLLPDRWVPPLLPQGSGSVNKEKRRRIRPRTRGARALWLAAGSCLRPCQHHALKGFPLSFLREQEGEFRVCSSPLTCSMTEVHTFKLYKALVLLYVRTRRTLPTIPWQASPQPESSLGPLRLHPPSAVSLGSFGCSVRHWICWHVL